MVRAHVHATEHVIQLPLYLGPYTPGPARPKCLWVEAVAEGLNERKSEKAPAKEEGPTEEATEAAATEESSEAVAQEEKAEPAEEKPAEEEKKPAKKAAAKKPAAKKASKKKEA